LQLVWKQLHLSRYIESFELFLRVINNLHVGLISQQGQKLSQLRRDIHLDLLASRAQVETSEGTEQTIDESLRESATLQDRGKRG
jgi:hypothetical protein